MKALVSTKETQGMRQTDFNFVDDGELLVFAPQCTDANPDSACGCRRSLLGIFSRRATTTFTVKDVKLTDAQFFDILYNYNKEFQNVDDPTLKTLATKDIKLIRATADQFNCGDVLERRDEYISVRKEAGK